MGGAGHTPKLLSTAAAVFDPRVEAAVLARYGVDPHRCTLRRLHVLLSALPPGYWPDADHSAVWSSESHLLAGLIDAVNGVSWMVAAVNSKRRPKQPKPVARPGAKPDKQRVTVKQLAAMFGGEGDG